ncbi:MAG: excinuclease ABC subunit UvrC [Rhodospirillales bacterium]|nr:excinuclease ABC subunit UvrC [Alphaproteobacteria bacterium]USO03633.1 MAG: excinuclease ABC subunit UvrC [Rhodospirillales bacterium]
MTQISLQRGAKLIRGQAGTLPDSPGVYRMLGAEGEALYVGKANSLKKRVVTYANVAKLPLRLQRMVAETASMEFVRTHTEVEALLLESNLIKKLKPRYNVLLRDDKSFPYILITGDHDFPQVKKHRGARKPKGEYFGPFAGAGAVNRTINVLQRAFLLRNCSDSVFKNRTRPCLQYHIRRCSAPCVGKASKEAYAGQVAQAHDFLSGKSRAIQARFAKEMQKASAGQNYELAASYRDRIRALASIHAQQDINVEGIGNADIIALATHQGKACIQIFFFRGGQNFGNHAYFPKASAEDAPARILSSFMAQFYDARPVPPHIYVGEMPDDRALLEEAFQTRIHCPSRGKRKRLVDFVHGNAADVLKRSFLQQAGEERLLKEVAKLFGLEAPPERIEIYDNSHISGTNMVGGMVVAGPEGFRKKAYRKFNIRKAAGSDDYGMMREVMIRRFTRALKETPEKGGEEWPDLLLIDGGKGQLGAVKEALEEVGVWDDLKVVAIAKGPDRNAGREQFFMEGKRPFQLPVNDAALHYLQRLRDEAHRFAIGAHRTHRKGDLSKSPLDDIPGVGAARKKALLHHFGSAKAVSRAGLEDLRKVEGVSKALAEKIYSFFNEV